VRRDAGLLLLECALWLAISVPAIAGIYAAFGAVHDACSRVQDAVEDLDEAGRVIEDLKSDLRQARKIRLGKSMAWMRMLDGREVLWSFAGADGVVRETPGDDRAYAAVFESASFGRDGRLVVVDVELRRDPRGSFRPRLRAAAFPRNEGGGP
jgi:hypothetical protein